MDVVRDLLASPWLLLRCCLLNSVCICVAMRYHNIRHDDARLLEHIMEPKVNIANPYAPLLRDSPLPPLLCRSLGMMMWELLSGRQPWYGLSEAAILASVGAGTADVGCACGACMHRPAGLKAIHHLSTSPSWAAMMIASAVQ